LLLSKKVFLSFLLCSIYVSSCTTPSNVKNIDTTKKSEKIVVESKEESINSLKETNVQFTQKIDGIDNPIAPEDIKSIEINDKIIDIKNIKISTEKFTTKATSEENFIQYLGSGKFKFNLVGLKILNSKNTTIKFNLASNKLVSFPLLKDIFDNNIRISYDSSNNKVYGGIFNNDGSINKTKPIFFIENNKLIVQESDGKETVFDSKDFTKPEKVSNMNQKHVDGQIEKINTSVNTPSPFYPYVGSWKIDFLAKDFNIPGYNNESKQRLTVTFNDLGNLKFKSLTKSFDVSGSAVSADYTSEGSYTAPIESFVAFIAGSDWEVKLIGENLLSAKLKATLLTQYKPFIGFTFQLTRVPSPDYKGE
jgi:hypothetical protein